MKTIDIAKTFAASFNQASGNVSIHVYANVIRFTAALLVIIAMMAAINHFMNPHEKTRDDFLPLLGSRVIRVTFGLTIFLLFLTV